MLKGFDSSEQVFKKAERLAEQAGEDEKKLEDADSVYRLSLRSFQSLLKDLDKNSFDSLRFLTESRSGLISYYLYLPAEAKQHYLQAIILKDRLPLISDSLLFLPYLYTGGIYYDENHFDSAFFYYKKAELTASAYATALDGAERLYNRLGVMYYETGDYRQARNYFEKAIALTPANTALKANYIINVASLLIKLEDYEAAKKMYESLLPQKIFTEEIYHNLAIISLRTDDPVSAISFLKNVKYENNKKQIDLDINLAMASSQLGKPDSAELYYQKALVDNLRWNGQRKNIQHGLILKFRADEFLQQEKWIEAATFFQQAIQQFDIDFNDTALTENPKQFTGVYSYINLFHCLTGKAEALKGLYDHDKNIDILKAALDAYKTAFRLADYVERTYESDEARLFLNKIKHAAHSRPIAISLELHQLTDERSYLEEAYYFDQRNKASVLSLGLEERNKTVKNSAEKAIRDKETMLRRNITRLTLKSSQTADSAALSKLTGEIRDTEIELGKIQDERSGTNSPSNRIPAINQLQKNLDNTTAIISWHLSEKEILALVITGNQFYSNLTPIKPYFFSSLDSFKSILHHSEPGKKYNGKQISHFLYQELMMPLIPRLSSIKRLVIIPDDELNYLPFEALQDNNGHYLVEKFSVQYQFSTTLLHTTQKKKAAAGILAFAPFASKGYKDSAGITWSVLPASKKEVIDLPGTILMDSIATREHFLRAANNYGLIHLATHASADNEHPEKSFISFFPNEKENRLYAPEISDMDLDSAQLIILSACETGTGQLIKGEGLMSLSRAFAYAGCPNVITSLWKADDEATAYLTKKLHHYLENGYTRDQALQKAKKDLLADENLDPRFKEPNYWAHLLFIGEYQSNQSHSPWWWVAGSLLFGGLLYLVVKTFSRKKS